jgi:hypothetical protein
MSGTRFVTRYPVSLCQGRADHCLEAYNPGFLKAPHLEIVRFLVASSCDPERRILSATVGDRPLLPMDLPIRAHHFFAGCALNVYHYSWLARKRLPRWAPDEWVRVQLDGPCEGIALLLSEPEGWRLPTFDRELANPGTCSRCGKREREHLWMCEHGHRLEWAADSDLPLMVCHGSGATLFCPTLESMN